MLCYKIDRSLNMARFYKVEVLPTLFGDWMVRREWGRIGGGWRALSETVATEEEAQALAGIREAAKLRRGYVAID